MGKRELATTVVATVLVASSQPVPRSFSRRQDQWYTDTWY